MISNGLDWTEEEIKTNLDETSFYYEFKLTFWRMCGIFKFRDFYLKQSISYDNKTF